MNKKSSGAHTNFGIQFLVFVELDSLHIGDNQIPDCLGKRNDTFIPPSLTFFISKTIIYKLIKV